MERKAGAAPPPEGVDTKGAVSGASSRVSLRSPRADGADLPARSTANALQSASNADTSDQLVVEECWRPASARYLHIRITA